MSYFIFDQSKPVNIFSNTTTFEVIAGQNRVAGNNFLETKDLPPDAMKFVFERDIREAVRNDDLPKMRFQISVNKDRPIPIYRFELMDLAEPIVFRKAPVEEEDFNCEDSSVGRVQLTELATYIRDKVSQIFWSHNADLISHKGIYGHTHFCYQIAFSPALIERQVRSFDKAKRGAAKKLLGHLAQRRSA